MGGRSALNIGGNEEMSESIMHPVDENFHYKISRRSMIRPYLVSIKFNSIIDGNTSKTMQVSYYKPNRNMYEFYTEWLGSTANHSPTIDTTKVFEAKISDIKSVSVEQELDSDDISYGHITTTRPLKTYDFERGNYRDRSYNIPTPILVGILIMFAIIVSCKVYLAFFS